MTYSHLSFSAWYWSMKCAEAAGVFTALEYGPIEFEHGQVGAWL